MAKPEAPKTPAAPRTITARKLDLVRHGNDDYSLAELTITGDGKAWATKEAKVLCAHVSRNVVSAYVEDWMRLFAGRGFMGDTGL